MGFAMLRRHVNNYCEVKIMIERKIQIKLTPNELAFSFCNMSSEGQAMFFNEIANLTNEWKFPLPFQLEAISGERGLTDSGRYVMSLIGEYSSQYVDTKK